MQLGTIAGIDFGSLDNLNGTVIFDPFSACADGNPQLTFLGLGEFSGPFSHCWGPENKVNFSASKDSVELGPIQVTDTSVQIAFNCDTVDCPDQNGVIFGGTVTIPKVFESTVSGTFFSENDFEFIGESELGDWGLGTGFDASSVLTIDEAGGAVLLSLNEGNDMALVSGVLTGNITSDPQTDELIYEFDGTGRVNVGGLHGTDASISYSSISGLMVSFEKDVGFGKTALFSGEIKQDGSYELLADVDYGVDGLATADGQLKLTPTELTMHVVNQATTNILGANTDFNAVYTLENGEITNVVLNATGDVTLNDVPITNGNLSVDSMTGSATLNGTVNLPPFGTLTVNGNVENGQTFNLTVDAKDSALLPNFVNYQLNATLTGDAGAVQFAHNGTLQVLGTNSTVSGSATLTEGQLASLVLETNSAAGMTLQGVDLSGGDSKATYTFDGSGARLEVDARLPIGNTAITGTIDSSGNYSLSGAVEKSISVNNINAGEHTFLRQIANIGGTIVGCVTSLEIATLNESICGCAVPGLFGGCSVANSCLYCDVRGNNIDHSVDLGAVNGRLDYLINNAGASVSGSASYTYNGMTLGASASGAFGNNQLCVSVASGELVKAAGSALGLPTNIIDVGDFNGCADL